VSYIYKFVFYASAPAIQPVSSVAKNAVHRPRIPSIDISLALDGTIAVNPPTKIPKLAKCTKPHKE
jgi:hypothetical protein